MFKRILLAYDGLPQTKPSLIYAIALSKALDARLDVLNVISEDNLAVAKRSIGKKCTEQRCLTRMRTLIDGIEQETGKLGFKSCNAISVVAPDVVSGVLKFSAKAGSDLAVLQPSLYHHSELVGDLAKKIFNELQIPTLFVKTGAFPASDRRILIPIDEKLRPEMDIALSVARSLSASIVFYHTTWKRQGLDDNDPLAHCEESVLKNIKDLTAKCKKLAIPFETIVETADTVHEGIILCAIRKETDLIVMFKSTAIVGSYIDLILEHSMYPVLVIQ